MVTIRKLLLVLLSLTFFVLPEPFGLLQAEGVLDQAALDRYSFIRDAWLQRRRSQVYDGNPPRVKEEE